MVEKEKKGSDAFILSFILYYSLSRYIQQLTPCEATLAPLIAQ
jgi:hypothetical protein